MNVLVIAGRIAATPWSRGALVTAVVSGLAGRGHQVRVLCESIERPAELGGIVGVSAFQPFRPHAPLLPAGFARWARDRKHAVERDVTLSLSRLVGGDAWWPLDPHPRYHLRRVFNDAEGGLPGIAAAGKFLAKHRGVGLAALLHSPMRVPSSGWGRVRRVCAVGPGAVGGAARDAADWLRAAGLSRQVVPLPYVSLLPLPTEAELADRRAEARRLLELPDDRPVFVAALTAGAGPPLRAMLAGLAAVVTDSGTPGRTTFERPPALILLASEPFRTRAHVGRAGLLDHARIFQPTGLIEHVLPACDAACILPEVTGPFGPASAYLSGSCGRFAADALRCGVPILAPRGTSAAGLLDRRGAEAPGLVFDLSAQAPWDRAFRVAMNPEWRRARADAARSAAAELDPARLLDALERVIEEAASERARLSVALPGTTWRPAVG